VDCFFDLSKKHRQFNASIMEALLSRIRANAVRLPLRSDHTDIRKLNDAFELCAKPLLINPIGDRMFFGEFESITTCTDLSWEDIALDAGPEIRRLFPAS
jgi:CRP-like cAMP-binding protein